MFLKSRFICFLVFLYSSFSIDAKVCSSASTLATQSQEILNCIEPECFSVGNIDKNKNPEQVLRQGLEKISEEEAVVRLIYAEMLASYCVSALSQDELQLMAQGIASVIQKRFIAAQKANRHTTLKDIVFQPLQFRSSTGSCDVAKRAEFMCPRKETQNWEKLWKQAQGAWQQIKSQDPLKSQAQHYFFYQHFKNSQNCSQFKGVIPAWAKPSLEVKVVPPMTKKLSECVRFFK